MINVKIQTHFIQLANKFTMDKYGEIVNLVLFVSILQIVTAQRCYQCVSSDVAGCGNPFTLTSQDNVQTEDCGTGECFFRRETVDSETVYTRGCSLAGQHKGCFTVTRGEECFCSGNLCNAASTMARVDLIPTVLTLALTLLLCLLV